MSALVVSLRSCSGRDTLTDRFPAASLSLRDYFAGLILRGGSIATNDGFLWGVVRGSAGGDQNGYLFAIHFSGSPYADAES